MKNAPPQSAYSLHRKCASHSFEENVCPYDPAHADYTGGYGSTWPTMAFVSHPQLSATAMGGRFTTYWYAATIEDQCALR